MVYSQSKMNEVNSTKPKLIFFKCSTVRDSKHNMYLHALVGLLCEFEEQFI